MAKIYTKTGDQGETSLFSGERVSKNHPLLHTYGQLDELNAFIGLTLSHMNEQSGHFEKLKPLIKWLIDVQNTLFVIGSHLACLDDKSRDNLPMLPEEELQNLEDQIDLCTAELPELRDFILPGGSTVAATLHVARTVCRRAERALIEIQSPEPDPFILQYINRLSDYLFVLARYSNQIMGAEEQNWIKK